jgi:hypothetical protein
MVGVSLGWMKMVVQLRNSLAALEFERVGTAAL